jgi:hypothetical protein
LEVKYPNRVIATIMIANPSPGYGSGIRLSSQENEMKIT